MAPQKILPTWLSTSIVVVFCLHFLIVIVFSFSRSFLPVRFLYYTDYYVSPWFYQYFAAFAPDPPLSRRIFIYRLKEDQDWGEWKNPSRSLLQDQWTNRFSPSIKTLDMVEAIGQNLHLTVKNGALDIMDTSYNWRALPAVQSAIRFVQINEHRSFDATDSLQIGVHMLNYSSNGDTINWIDSSFVLLPIALANE